MQLSLKGLYRHEILLAAGLAACTGLGIGIYFYAGIPPVRGLRISAPDLSALSRQQNQSVVPQSLSGVGSASFMAAMGLDISPVVSTAAVVIETAKIEKPAPPPPASVAVAVEPPPRPVDLEKSGYKLRGIILEDGRSAAFVYVPSEKRVMVIRENASGSIRLLEAGLRSIKLQTPDGAGLLTLETARSTQVKSAIPMSTGSTAGKSNSLNRSSGTGGSGRAATMSQQPGQPGQSAQPGSAPRVDAFAGPNKITENINNGQLRLSRERGRFMVEVREVPETLKGFAIMPGDKIIGTEAGDFSRAADIAHNLGRQNERPLDLKVNRNGRVIFIKAPRVAQPPASDDTSKTGQAQQPPPHGQPLTTQEPKKP